MGIDVHDHDRGGSYRRRGDRHSPHAGAGQKQREISVVGGSEGDDERCEAS